MRAGTWVRYHTFFMILLFPDAGMGPESYSVLRQTRNSFIFFFIFHSHFRPPALRASDEIVWGTYVSRAAIAPALHIVVP